MTLLTPYGAWNAETSVASKGNAYSKIICLHSFKLNEIKSLDQSWILSFENFWREKPAWYMGNPRMKEYFDILFCRLKGSVWSLKLQKWNCSPSNAQKLEIRGLSQNLYWKSGQQSAIFWNSLGLFRDYGLNHIFFRNKTFLFFKIKSWKKIVKPHKTSTPSDNG